ncbi:MAG: hypothetical protein OXT67_10745 [Zetaproteobacteria bacterium]|nr:hypothetical protein [Zetaproteobacteria bacterium]
MVLRRLCFLVWVGSMPTLNARPTIYFHVEEGASSLYESEDSKLVADFMQGLNAVQDDFEFRYQVNPSRRFLVLFEENAVDAVFLLDEAWVAESLSKMHKSDFYMDLKNQLFTLKTPGISQDYFADMTKMSKVGMFGYYYRLFDFKRDPAVLKRDYNAALVKKEIHMVRMVESGRVQVGIIGDLTVRYFAQNGQIDPERLYFSEVPDAVYQPRLFLKKGIALTQAQLDGYVLEMKRQGILQSIFGRYGILDNIRSWLEKAPN